MSGEEKDPLLDDLRRRIEIRTADGPEAIIPFRPLVMLDPKVIRAAIAWRNWFTSSPVRTAEANEFEQALVDAIGQLPPAPDLPR